MRVTAPHQNMIISLLIKQRKPMSIKELTNNCQLTYFQVSSCLLALKSKGYVRRIRTGLYEATEEARLIELEPESQVRVLQRRVAELEEQVRSLTIRIASMN